MDGLEHKIGCVAVRATTQSVNDFEDKLKKLAEEFLPSESASLQEVTEGITKIFLWEKQAHIGSVNLANMAKVSRWCMGHCLLRIKRELGHGNYGPWLEENRERIGFSQRSAENYTNLAKEYEALEDFLESLRAEPDAEEEIDDEQLESEVDPGKTERDLVGSKPTKVEGVLKSCTTLQKRIRQLVESGEKLSSADLAQIKSVGRELNELMEKVEGRCDEDHAE